MIDTQVGTLDHNLTGIAAEIGIKGPVDQFRDTILDIALSNLSCFCGITQVGG
jgi:hypothetical protein